MQNRQRIWGERGKRKRRAVEYEIGDQILLWEPQQKQVVRNDTPKTDESLDKTTMPAKWTDNWTGPHVVVKKIARGKDKFSYEIHHRERSKDIPVVTNKLTPYCPWSDGIASTSRPIDCKRAYESGEWVKTGSTVLVPLEKPYPFGVAKLLSHDKDGNLQLQWMGNKNNDVRGVYRLGWVSSKGTVYYADTPRALQDKPYTTDMDDIHMNQRDVLMHDFGFTPAGKLTQGILRAVADHPYVWWQPASMKRDNPPAIRAPACA